MYGWNPDLEMLKSTFVQINIQWALGVENLSNVLFIQPNEVWDYKIYIYIPVSYTKVRIFYKYVLSIVICPNVSHISWTLLVLLWAQHATWHVSYTCLLPRRGLEEVTGMVSATMFRNTVRDSKIVTPYMKYELNFNNSYISIVKR